MVILRRLNIPESYAMAIAALANPASTGSSEPSGEVDDAAEDLVVQGEVREAYNDLFAQYLSIFGAQTVLERNLVEEMTSACWRMRRLWAMESNMMDKQISMQTSRDPLVRITEAFAIVSDTPKYGALGRTESRLQRIYHRACKTLLHLQQTKTALAFVG